MLTKGVWCSYERFLWAVGTVRARTHAPLDGAATALVPLADLVGLVRQSPVQWPFHSSGSVADLPLLQAL